jgi:Domain of unknown function (DUF4259)
VLGEREVLKTTAHKIGQTTWYSMTTSILSCQLSDKLLMITWSGIDTAIAAAEVAAALKGYPSGALPTAIKEWIRSHNLYVDTNIIELAIRVINRALNTHELRDLWADQTEHDEWKRVVEDLRLRLEM